MTWFSMTSLAHVSTKNAWMYLIDGIVLEFLPSEKVVLRLCAHQSGWSRFAFTFKYQQQLQILVYQR